VNPDARRRFSVTDAVLNAAALAPANVILRRAIGDSMPEPTNVRSVLAVRDLAASTDWYTRVLGMTIDFTAPGWSFLSRGAFRVMLGECIDATPAGELGDHSYFLYVTVDDIDAFFGEVIAKGVSLTQHLASKPWGMREFGVRTPDGHRIMFGQELGVWNTVPGNFF
jgi:uncharacterized glyoxalase superfamily protein PhnB